MFEKNQGKIVQIVVKMLEERGGMAGSLFTKLKPSDFGIAVETALKTTNKVQSFLV